MINENIRITLRSCLSCLLLLGVSSCGYDAPTTLKQSRIEVHEETNNFDLETAELTDEALANIAHHYTYNGNGPIDVTVTYNPGDRRNSAMAASDQVSRIVRALRKNDVEDIDTNILPITKQGVSKTYFSYTTYHAQMPEGCSNATDIDDLSHENYRDYELGCGTMDYIAQQISKPKDLLGLNEITEETDSRKRSNVIEGNKWTVRNAPLSGESASEL